MSSAHLVCFAAQAIANDAVASCGILDAAYADVVLTDSLANVDPPGTDKGGVDRSTPSPTVISGATQTRGFFPYRTAFVQLVACTLVGRPAEGTIELTATVQNTVPGAGLGLSSPSRGRTTKETATGYPVTAAVGFVEGPVRVVEHTLQGPRASTVRSLVVWRVKGAVDPTIARVKPDYAALISGELTTAERARGAVPGAVGNASAEFSFFVTPIFCIIF